MDSAHAAQRGFTLIELAIVVLVSGLFMATFASFYAVEMKHAKHRKTAESIAAVGIAIDEFRARTGRFPCPADRTLTRADANYGVETLQPGGGCVIGGGVVRTTGRDTDLVGGGDDVAIGMVPIRTISSRLRNTSLSEENILDGWGNRLTYAVSESMTVSSTLSDFRGAIDIVDEFDQSVVNPAGSAQVAFVSHGENGRGAYTAEGRLVRPCTTGVVVTPPPGTLTLVSEIENCNDDATFLNGLRRTEDNNYNDDVAGYHITKSSSPWRYTGAVTVETEDPADPADPDGPRATTLLYQIANANTGGYVGFGTDSPEEQLHFASSVRAQSVQASQICDADGNTCMPIDVLAGESPDMTCPAGQAVRSISENRVQCAPITFSISGAQTCPAGEYIYAVSNLGRIFCRPLSE